MSSRPISPAASIWMIGAIMIALPIAVPTGAILATFVAPTTEVWEHLRDTVLTEYVVNTVTLLLGVGLLTAIIGVACAWLCATREFTGRRFFAWALILPFAAPAYVVAYAYADLLEFAGPLQSFLRDLGYTGALPPIRSLSGAILVLSFVVYPYVYLFAYTAFAEQAKPLAEAARSLGASSYRAFFRVALPHARPAIAGGSALGLMETAADFGVVDFYGVPTLTTGIFRTWFAQGEQQAALQLAGWLFVIVAVLVVFERLARRGLHANPVSRNASDSLRRLRGASNWAASIVCAVPLLFGFVLPATILAFNALTNGDPMLGTSFSDYVGNTVYVATIAALAAVACATWLVYATRLNPGRLTQIGVRAATLGYAFPGMVLAVGLIGPLTSLDKWMARSLADWFDIRSGLLLTGSAGILIFVYLARFLTVAFNSCDSGMARIHPQYDAAARTLGAAPSRLLTRIHLPIMYPAVLSALLLVFIDVVKELPATLILRPFNFETLATRAYRLASDERIAEASTAALAIVALGLVPTLLLARQTFSKRKAT